MRRKLIAAILMLAFSCIVNGQSAKVVAEKASLRGRPADDAKVVETLARNTVVEVMKVDGLWYLVQANDYAGWMFIKDLEVARAPAASHLRSQPITQPKSDSASDGPASSTQPRTTNRTYIRGSRGGCYYLSPSGSKVYVARDLCS